MKNLQILLILIFLLAFSRTKAQEDSCQIALMNATEYFDRGMYSDVVSLLEKRVDHCDYTREARLQALKILAASYSELDEQEQAEATTKKFLKLAPVYKLQGIDPPRFAGLFEHYSVEPLLSLGVSVGMNKNMFQVAKKFGIWDAAGYTSAYSSSNQLSANINILWQAWKRLALGTELGFSSLNYNRTIGYTNYSMVYSEKVTAFKLPVYLTFNLFNYKKLSFDVLSGVYGYNLSNVSYSYTTNYSGVAGKGSGDATDSRTLRGAGLVEGLKFGYRTNRFVFSFEPRYYHNFTLFNKSSMRYSDVNFNLNNIYVDDDFRINQVEFLFGVSYTLSYKIKHKYH